VLPIFLAMTANETLRAEARHGAARGHHLRHHADCVRRGRLAHLPLLRHHAGRLQDRRRRALVPRRARHDAGASVAHALDASEEEKEGIEKADVAIIPLAIPLLSGPGSIATVMVLMARHPGYIYTIPVFASIVLTAVITWLTLRGAGWIRAAPCPRRS